MIIKYNELDLVPYNKEPDLIAPEGYVIYSKVFNTVIGKSVNFVTRTHLRGKKLDEPLVETKDNFEFVKCED